LVGTPAENGTAGAYWKRKEAKCPTCAASLRPHAMPRIRHSPTTPCSQKYSTMLPNASVVLVSGAYSSETIVQLPTCDVSPKKNVIPSGDIAFQVKLASNILW